LTPAAAPVLRRLAIPGGNRLPNSVISLERCGVTYSRRGETEAQGLRSERRAVFAENIEAILRTVRDIQKGVCGR
jgi:hypothetical protein